MSWLDGKKTYIVAALAGLYGLTQYIAGTVQNQEIAAIVWIIAGAAASLRDAIGKMQAK